MMSGLRLRVVSAHRGPRSWDAGPAGDSLTWWASGPPPSGHVTLGLSLCRA